MNRFKILVSAYACEPGKGSEPGVGWNWTIQIARFHNVWVITRENNRESIERYLRDKNNQISINFIYYDLPKWLRFWKKGQRGVQLYYYLWQIGIYFLSKKLHKKIQFDLVHHLTFGVYWLPSFLFFLKIPFVWGPVGGAEKAPDSFLSSFSIKGKIFEYVRNFIQWIGETDPFWKLMIKNSNFIITKAKETYLKLNTFCTNDSIQIFSESAISSNDYEILNKISTRNKRVFKIISIGRLIDWKGFHLSLLSFIRFIQEYPNSEYYFLGDGYARKTLEEIVRKYNCENKVHFWGNVPRNIVLEQLNSCDVLIHPSLHDSGGWVCLEAMAAGKPVICLDIGGPALQVTEETGFKIPAINPEQVIHDMAEAMLKLANNPELRRKMGEAGRKRVEEHFNWDKKGNFINQIYQEVLSKK